jgi:hypothetical protein
MRTVPLLIAIALWAGAAAAESFAELVEERARASFGATLPPEAHFTINYQPEIDDALLISRFWIDAATGQFVAEVVRESAAVERISGLALVTVPVPVPARRLLPDEIIGESRSCNCQSSDGAAQRFFCHRPRGPRGPAGSPDAARGPSGDGAIRHGPARH